MEACNFDVEKYRKAHESNSEWKLRRQFLLDHQQRYELPRLLCLANCFVNVECYGCRFEH